jgi:hypothetical protein
MNQTIDAALAILAEGDIPGAVKALNEAGIPAEVDYTEMGVLFRVHEPGESTWAYTVAIYVDTDTDTVSMEVRARTLFGTSNVARRLHNLVARLERGELVHAVHVVQDP